MMRLSELEIEDLKKFLLKNFHHHVDYSLLPPDELDKCITQVLTTINSTNYVISPGDFNKKSSEWKRYCGIDFGTNNDKKNEVYFSTLATAVQYYYELWTKNGLFEPFSIEQLYYERHKDFGFDHLCLENKASKAILTSLLETRKLIIVLSTILPTFTQAIGLQILKRVEGTWEGATGTGAKKEVKQRKSLLNAAKNKKSSSRKRGREDSPFETHNDNTDSSCSGSCHSPKKIKDNQGNAIPLLEQDIVNLLRDVEEFDDIDFISKASSVDSSFGEINFDKLLLIFQTNR
eukprot:gene11919-13004_t